MKLNIPFIKSRGFECGQACAAMMIKYYYPEFEPDFNEFNKIMGHKSGLYTFPSQEAVLLDHFNLKIKCFSSKEYFKSEKEFEKSWGSKNWKEQKRFVDLTNHEMFRLKMLEFNLFEKREHSLDQILEYTHQGFPVQICIDWNTLINKSGPYAGHFVIISGIEDEKVLIHDPDFEPYMSYDKEQLKKAYNHPVIDNDIIVAFGRK